MREYPNKPVVAVGAVVLRKNAVLLIKRAKEPNKGSWSLPGGRQEQGETIGQTAEREVLEETGVRVSSAGLVDIVDSITKDKQGRIAYHYALIEMLCHWRSGDPVAGDDAIDARWVNLQEIENIELWDETIRIIKKAVELRSTC